MYNSGCQQALSSFSTKRVARLATHQSVIKDTLEQVIKRAENLKNLCGYQCGGRSIHKKQLKAASS